MKRFCRIFPTKTWMFSPYATEKLKIAFPLFLISLTDERTQYGHFDG